MLPYRTTSWLRLLFTWHGSSSRGVMLRVLTFGAIAVAVVVADHLGARVHLPAGVHETTAAVVALILAFRTNTGYNRFWEGRTLWGSIVNASRNLSRFADAHVRCDAAEKESFRRWIVVFAYVTRRRLRSEAKWPEADRLLTEADAAALAAAPHPPLHAAARLSSQLARWIEAGQVDRILALPAERWIATLVDNLGGCERILKTPTPLGYVLLMERFIAVYLATLPFMLVTRVESLTPVITVIVAYPILLIDALGAALDDPFGHDPSDLPLTRICLTIERDVVGTTPDPAVVYTNVDVGRGES